MCKIYNKTQKTSPYETIKKWKTCKNTNQLKTHFYILFKPHLKEIAYQKPQKSNKTQKTVTLQKLKKMKKMWKYTPMIF